tara:strand:+ start:1531 stop:1974 length:444 start_codon:yes stop_codon:yes gene_type:complete
MGNDYNYNEFLNDSSDDAPKYETDALLNKWKNLMQQKRMKDKLDSERESVGFPCDAEDEQIFKSRFVVKQGDDDMNYQQAYSNREIHIALENVLELAGERLEQFQSPDYLDADIVNAMDSIKLVKDYFFHSGEAIINNSQIAKDNSE